MDRQQLLDIYLDAYMKSIPGSDMEEAYLTVASMLIYGYGIDACTQVLHERTRLAQKKEGLQL